MRIFINYAHKDRAVTTSLVEGLRSLEYSVWYDQELVSGTAWFHKILENIEQCDVMLFMLSSASLESQYCQAEYKYALKLNKPLLPVMVESVELPFALQQIQFIDHRLLDVKETLVEVARAINVIEDKKRIYNEYTPPEISPERPDFTSIRQSPTPQVAQIPRPLNVLADGLALRFLGASIAIIGLMVILVVILVVVVEMIKTSDTPVVNEIIVSPVATEHCPEEVFVRHPKLEGPAIGVSVTITTPEMCTELQEDEHTIPVGGNYAYAGSLDRTVIWVLVYPHLDDSFYPQGSRPCEGLFTIVAEGKWRTDIHLGGGAGTVFDVIVAVSQEDSPASQAIRQWFQKECETGIDPLPFRFSDSRGNPAQPILPEGLTELNSITIYKQFK